MLAFVYRVKARNMSRPVNVNHFAEAPEVGLEEEEEEVVPYMSPDMKMVMHRVRLDAGHHRNRSRYVCPARLARNGYGFGNPAVEEQLELA